MLASESAKTASKSAKSSSSRKRDTTDAESNDRNPLLTTHDDANGQCNLKSGWWVRYVQCFPEDDNGTSNDKFC